MKRLFMFFIIILSMFFFANVKAEENKEYIYDFSKIDNIFDFKVVGIDILNYAFDEEYNKDEGTIYKSKKTGKPLFILKDIDINVYDNVTEEDSYFLAGTDFGSEDQEILSSFGIDKITVKFGNTTSINDKLVCDFSSMKEFYFSSSFFCNCAMFYGLLDSFNLKFTEEKVDGSNFLNITRTSDNKLLSKISEKDFNINNASNVTSSDNMYADITDDFREIFREKIQFDLPIKYNQVRFLFAEEEHDDVEITSVKIIDKNISKYLTPTYNVSSINFSSKVNNVGDFIKYRITFKNTSDEDYKVKINSVNSDYFEYKVEYDGEDSIVKSNSTSSAIVSIKYKTAVPEELVLHNYEEAKVINLNLSFEEEKENETIADVIVDTVTEIVNPKTGDSRPIIIITAVLIASSILSVILFRKSPKIFVILLFAVLLTPIIADALKEKSFKINSTVKVSLPPGFYINNHKMVLTSYEDQRSKTDPRYTDALKDVDVCHNSTKVQIGYYKNDAFKPVIGFTLKKITTNYPTREYMPANLEFMGNNESVRIDDDFIYIEGNAVDDNLIILGYYLYDYYNNLEYWDNFIETNNEMACQPQPLS